MRLVDAVVGNVADLVQRVGGGVQDSRGKNCQCDLNGMNGSMRGPVSQKEAGENPGHGWNQRERPGKRPVDAQGVHARAILKLPGIADKGKRAGALHAGWNQPQTSLIRRWLFTGSAGPRLAVDTPHLITQNTTKLSRRAS